MNTEMRKFPQLLALAVALGGTLALAACQPTSESADTTAPSTAEQQTPPPEPTPSAPSDVSGGSSTTPAADATNTAPPTDDAGAMPPPATAPTTPAPTDADKAGSEPPKPADEAKPEEKK